MDTPWNAIDMASPTQVVRVLEQGAEANLSASCRRGSIDVIAPPGRVILTGDLHDNLGHLLTIVEQAEMFVSNETSSGVVAHLTLQELIHSDRLHDGMDPSYRMLVRAAAMKIAFPDYVHAILGNHELSQVYGSGVMKHGINCVKAFEAAIDYIFASEAAVVANAVRTFIESMPLALRIEQSNCEDWLCSHSLPSGSVLEDFDWSVLDRRLTKADFAPRTGAAHAMVWGRGHTQQEIDLCANALNLGQIVIGHEHAPEGWAQPYPNFLILNSDHARGVFLRADLAQLPVPSALAASLESLSRVM